MNTAFLKRKWFLIPTTCILLLVSLLFGVWWKYFRIGEPLHYACYMGDIEEVKRLIAEGWDVNARSKEPGRSLKVVFNIPPFQTQWLWYAFSTPLDICNRHFNYCSDCYIQVPTIEIKLALDAQFSDKDEMPVLYENIKEALNNMCSKCSNLWKNRKEIIKLLIVAGEKE